MSQAANESVIYGVAIIIGATLAGLVYYKIFGGSVYLSVSLANAFAAIAVTTALLCIRMLRMIG